MRETATAEAAQARQTTRRTIRRRGLLTGALALAASTAAASLPGIASAATPQEPTKQGFWVLLGDAWLQVEKLTETAIQELVKKKVENVLLEFRSSGLPYPVWARHTAPMGDASVSDTRILAIYERGTTPPSRKFVYESAMVEGVRVYTEADGDDTLLFTDFYLTGRRLTHDKS